MKFQKPFWAIAFVMAIALFAASWLPNATTAKASASAVVLADSPNGSSACKLYSAGDLPIATVDLDTITSTISVGDNFVIDDVNVHNLNINHTWDSDLRTYLVSPAGTRIALFLNVGGNGDDFINMNLDDSDPDDVQDGAAPFTDTYHPVESLSTFIGEATLGDWHMEIEDTNSGDSGALTGWQLELCTGGVIPTETPVPTAPPTSTATSTPVSTAPNTATPTATNTGTTQTVTPTAATPTATSGTPAATATEPSTPVATETPVGASGDIYLPIIAR